MSDSCWNWHEPEHAANSPTKLPPKRRHWAAGERRLLSDGGWHRVDRPVDEIAVVLGDRQRDVLGVLRLERRAGPGDPLYAPVYLLAEGWLVSVVIPTRDRSAFVPGAVRSALDQAGARIEVCVVDDGSREPVALPAELASDERVTLIRTEMSRGAAAARNTGLAATRGDLVAFLDDDDQWLAGKLARQLEALWAAGPNTVMVACGFEVWDGRRLVAGVLPPAGINSGALLAHPCVWTSTVLVRRSAVMAAGGFDELLSRAEDWDLWVRLAELGEITVVPEVLVDRRWVPLAPATAWAARALIAPRLDARLSLLPSRHAACLLARRHRDDGVVLARLGRRRDAVATLLAAWRTCPLWSGPPLGLARALAGERAWRVARSAAAPARARLRPRLPRPPGPAPRWAAP